MNYKKIIISMAVLTFIFSAGMSSVQAESIESLQSQDNSVRADLILNSIEMGDYETWLRLVNRNSKLAQKIDKNDFYEFVKTRSLVRQGKYKEALKLYENLKLKLNLSDDDIKKIVNYLEIQMG